MKEIQFKSIDQGRTSKEEYRQKIVKRNTFLNALRCRKQHEAGEGQMPNAQACMLSEQLKKIYAKKTYSNFLSLTHTQKPGGVHVGTKQTPGCIRSASQIRSRTKRKLPCKITHSSYTAPILVYLQHRHRHDGSW